MKTVKKRLGRQVVSQLAFPILLIIVIGLLSCWSYQRNEIWGDWLHLWIDTVKKSPNKARPYNNVGSFFLGEKQLEEAQPWIVKAVLLDERCYEAQNNLGILLAAKGKYKEAIERLEVAKKGYPYSWEIHNNLGLYLAELGRYDEAMAELRESLRIFPHQLTLNNINDVRRRIR